MVVCMDREYNIPVSIRIPSGVLRYIDDQIESEHEFTNRSDFILHAVRVYVDLRTGMLRKPQGGGGFRKRPMTVHRIMGKKFDGFRLSVGLRYGQTVIFPFI